MWFQDFVTVFNQSYNCQTSHCLGRNRLPKSLLMLPSLGTVYVKWRLRNLPLFKPVNTIQNASKHVKMHQKASKHIKTHQKASKHIKTYQNVSKRIKKYQKTTWACPHQTFCLSDVPVSDAYRPPPFHIWKWWPPLTTKAPTAMASIGLVQLCNYTGSILYCFVLSTILSFWSHGPIQACSPIFAYPIWNWLHISSFINSLCVLLHTV